MHITHLDREAALAALQTGASGLTEAEAARRLREFGPNRVEEAPRQALWLGLLREFTSFFALILWVAAALALSAEHFAPGQGMGRLGVAIMAVILINGVFSFIQEYRAERAVAALRGLLPQRVRVLRAGVAREVDAADLVPGDLLQVEEGERVPADCRLIEAAGVRVDLSTVTGESVPAARNAAAEPDAGRHGPALLHGARNALLAGTALVSGHGLAVVFATGMRTEFGRIAHLTQTVGESTSPLQREIVRLSRLVAVLATGLGVVFFLIGRAAGLPFWESFMFTIGIIVANVPEGLLPTVTLSLAMATQRMARRNALVRHLPAVEALGSTTVILSDKTGTLTGNRMAVRRIHCDGHTIDAACPPDGQPPSLAQTALLRAAALCHSLRRADDGGWLGDPMELALVQLAQDNGAATDTPLLAELPFDSERRRMSVVAHSGQRRVLYCKGALETLLDAASSHAVDGVVAPLDGAARAALCAAQDAMARAGLRVLALGWRELAADEEANDPDLERRLTIAGLAGLDDPPRPEVPGAIARCHEAGIRVVMCTGDLPTTAVAIGREIGLIRTAQPLVLHGDALQRMTPAQLQLALDAPEVLFARVTAEQKMLVVQALQRKGEVVAVTGDGVNDAPALKCADIGIAMGIAGTDVAREAADIVLLDDHFATIVNAIEEGRAVFDNLRKFLTYILTSNMPELVPYLAFVLLRIPLPLTILQILAVDLGTDLLPALALGAERPAADVMRRPPRRKGERLLNPALLLRAYLWLGPMQAGIALAAYFFVLHAGGWQWGQALATDAPLYLQATTACLGAIVLAQVMNVFLCRHPSQPVWRFGLFANALLLWGIGAELGLLALIVLTAPGQDVFGTAVPEAEVWWLVIPLVLVMGTLEEGRKWAVRRLMDAPG